MINHTYAVVMAGGSGTRFWPLSREDTPKQVLSIINDNSLIENTINRITKLIPLENLRIVTNAKQQKIMTPILPNLMANNYIIEPFPRNTAACIGLAAMSIYRKDPDAIMVVFPADHLIQKEDEFLEVIEKGVQFVADNDALAVIGIKPTRPATGYGYIQFDMNNGSDVEGVKKVKTFAEKPNKETAEQFLRSGDFRWNAGIFVWRASRILEELKTKLAEVYDPIEASFAKFEEEDFDQILFENYSRAKQISIDYGVMETTDTPIFMLEGDFGWSDVGSWDELYRISNKNREENVVIGDAVTFNANNNYIHSPDQLTAVIGLSNVLIVNTKDALLICSLDQAEEVKRVVEKLKRENRKEFL